MIYFLIGENSFEIEREVSRLVRDFDGAVEKKDADAIELSDLSDFLMGQTLFSDKRLIIIKQLSENKKIWDALPEMAEKMSNDVDIALVEAKPDKRTKTYKDLQKLATVKEFPVWTLRDTQTAVQWVVDEATAKGLTFTGPTARHLVQRAGVDQWRLFHAIEKLAVLQDVSIERINDTIDAHPSENVFALLETALRGDSKKMLEMIASLEQTEDPYRIFGLLSSQILQLAALSYSDKSVPDVAKDIGAPPFVLSKLALFASRLSNSEAKAIVGYAAEADRAMKLSVAEPWVLIERMLLKIAL